MADWPWVKGALKKDNGIANRRQASHGQSSLDPEVVRVWLLGDFRASVGARFIEGAAWQRRKMASLIKALALAPGHRLHREQVMDLLWPDLDPKAAANNLRQTMHRTRNTLDVAGSGPYVRLDGEMVSLCPETPLWVDVEAFEAAATIARRSREPAAYRAALDLYAGDLLPEDRYEPWAEEKREELRRLRRALILGLAGLREGRGEYDSAIETLEPIADADPSDETSSSNLMRLYALDGRPRDALLRYEKLRGTLRREFEAVPSSATRELAQAIRVGKLTATPVRPPRETAGGPTKHNLPLSLTSFVGREQEMLQVRRALSMTRLLTLTGVGGSGKTRIALEVARDLSGSYPDGVWFVQLAPLSEEGLIGQAVAQALGVREQAGRPLLRTLSDHLESKTTLLVLDNCEHLVDAAARLVEMLLTSCRNLSVLATSREYLGVAGETVWPVAPMSLPGGDDDLAVENTVASEAVRLFAERARSRLPGFELTRENVSAVSRVCRKLDGIPLAIELAAARLGALAVDHVAEKLEESLDLRTGERTVAPRQRTLRATLDWSHEPLDEAERALFRRLSVFAGGWTLEAAEGVCTEDGIERASVPDLLSRLVDKSLVLAEGSPSEGSAYRYRLLEPVRQYAFEKLDAVAGPRTPSDERRAIQLRHAMWFLTLAETAEPELVGPEQAVWFERLETEHDNLRAALRWSLDAGESELALRLAGTLGKEFWRVRGRLHEGLGWLDAALEKGRHASPARARALASAGWIAWQWLDFDKSRSLSEEALVLSRGFEGQQATAAISLHNLGMIEIYSGMRAREAWGYFEESLALWRELGDKVGAGRVLQRMGLISVVRHDFDRAHKLYEECIALLREAGDSVGVTVALWLGGLAALGRGEHHGVKELCADGLALARRTGNIHAVSYLTQVLAASCGAQGLIGRSARLWGAAEALLDTLGLALGPAERHFYAPYIAAARESIGQKAWDAAWAEGKEVTPEEILALPQEGAGPLPEPESATGATLTRREREVAALVGRGLANRRIAEELTISERTVETHARNILRKLGLETRTQVATWATRQGLASIQD